MIQMPVHPAPQAEARLRPTAVMDDDGELGSEPLPPLLESYYAAIGRTPLLTAAAEVALAQRIAQGDTSAALTLAQANLRLVVSVARRYLRRGLPLEDLIAEGNLGLLRAVVTYDWQRGYRFSTYATWWIRQAITRSLVNTGGLIRLPAHAYEALTRRAKALDELTVTLGRQPTAAEMEEALGDTSPVLEAAAAAAQLPVSLDASVEREGEQHPLAPEIPDGAAPTPEEQAVGRTRSADLREILQEVLTARECCVMTLRFGLCGGGEPATLDEVGRCMGITRERVRQIEYKALHKLRRPAVAERLRGL